MEKTYTVNSNQKRAGMALQILGKIDFKTKIVTRKKEKHFIMIRSQFIRKT